MSDALSSVAIAPPEGEEGVVLEHPREFPLGFEPLRSERLAEMKLATSPVVRNPYMSPLLAPDSMLRGLPPIHLVVRGREMELRTGLSQSFLGLFHQLLFFT